MVLINAFSTLFAIHSSVHVQRDFMKTLTGALSVSINVLT